MSEIQSSEPFCVHCGFARSGHDFLPGACPTFVGRNPRGVPIERPAIETTDRIPALALVQEAAVRRAAVARLLTELEISTVLELVSELATARSRVAEGIVREELELIAGVAAELAGGARNQSL
jgi:hypothetical protein